MKNPVKTKKKITNQILFDQFAKIDQRFEKIDQHFEQLELMIKVGFDEVDQRFVDLEERLEQKMDRSIRLAVAPLATKDFVGQKIGQLRAEFVKPKRNLTQHNLA